MDEVFVFGGVIFEWDSQKSASNFAKHRVSFAEGATVFADHHAIFISDPDHSDDEERFLLVGVSRVRRILVVVSVERGERFRIISARKAVWKEIESYEEGRDQ